MAWTSLPSPQGCAVNAKGNPEVPPVRTVELTVADVHRHFEAETDVGKSWGFPFHDGLSKSLVDRKVANRIDLRSRSLIGTTHAMNCRY